LKEQAFRNCLIPLSNQHRAAFMFMKNVDRDIARGGKCNMSRIDRTAKVMRLRRPHHFTGSLLSYGEPQA
jgi:hypothetical protein